MNIERLKQILSIQSASYDQWRMFAFLIRHAITNGYDYEVLQGNIYITKGNSDVYPCVVAHMDTVHDMQSNLTALEIGDNITGFNAHTMQQVGIGGDDKVGIYIALECLDHFDNIKVAFFRDEEVGCEGSYLSYMPWFDDCSFVLQCDRKGNSDFVATACGVSLSSLAFQSDIMDVILKYGYHFNDYGGMTDVMALKEIGLPVACANMSCGYYNPHSNDEYVNVPDVSNCLDMVIEIIDTCGDIQYKHTYSYKKKEEKKEKQKALPYYGIDDWRHSYKSNYCDCCGEKASKLIYTSDYHMFICKTCNDKYRINADNKPKGKYDFKH